MVATGRTAPSFHPAIVAAAKEFAGRLADMVADQLQAIDRRCRATGHPRQIDELPAEFLLQLGAICQLALWEAQGFREFLSPDLPLAAAAREDPFRRAIEAP
jgi:hypothetical protein